MQKKQTPIRIAAMGDLHVKEVSQKQYQELFKELSEKADILVLCGDLTDRGLVKEAEILAEDLAFLKIPAVGVLGNHDFESGKQEEVKKILTSAHLTILDGEPSFEFHGIGFSGVKGFCGGFGKYILSPFGEEAIKAFAHESVNEALKLENALIRLKTRKKVVLLHYSPIKETVEGEPEEIFPFLGSSRLSEPIDTFAVSAVFHGHADYGTPEGKTAKGIPVYNVALPLLKRLNPNQPYALIEV